MLDFESDGLRVWLNGFITKVDMTIEPGCIISILAVGNTDQDTYRSEIHEIHLPPAPAHM